MERDNLTSCSQVMVELTTRQRKMIGDAGNHSERLGLKRVSWASKFSIPNMAGTSHDLVGNNTDMRSSIPNQASCTPDFTSPLISSLSFLSSSPISVSSPHLYHHRRTQCYVVPPNLSMPWSWGNTESSVHWVQHTPSTADTEYSIHRAQHIPEIVCPPFIFTRYLVDPWM